MRARESRVNMPEPKYGTKQKVSKAMDGTCANCSKPAAPGVTLCKRHLLMNRERMAARVKRNYELGLCRCGGDRVEGYRQCAECRTRTLAHNESMKRARKNSGHDMRKP